MYYSINRWGYFRERKAPFTTTLFKKGGMAYFRVVTVSVPEMCHVTEK